MRGVEAGKAIMDGGQTPVLSKRQGSSPADRKVTREQFEMLGARWREVGCFPQLGGEPYASDPDIPRAQAWAPWEPGVKEPGLGVCCLEGEAGDIPEMV